METNSEIRARLDVRINREELALCRLRAQRNTYSLIFRLPEEILAAIFIHCARDHYNDILDWLTVAPTPPWLCLSHVCHHWRRVALDWPTIWSYIFVTSPRCIEEVLTRSKGVSLRVVLRLNLPFTEQVMQHLERIQDLRLIIPDTLGYGQFFSEFPLRAPRLRFLEISMPVSKNVTWIGQPRSALQWDTPALRTLKICRCSLPLSSFGLHGLTVLTLYHIPLHLRQGVGSFISALQWMQDLTHLHLEDALDTMSWLHDTNDTSFKINLPRLSRIYIAELLPIIAYLLSRVDVPATAEIRLTCYNFSETIDHNHKLIPPLSQRLGLLGNHPSLTIRSIVVGVGKWYPALCVVFSASERDCDVLVDASDMEWDCNIPLKVTLLNFFFSEDNTEMEPGVEDYLNNILGDLPLPRVQRLHIIKPLYRSDFWWRLLEHMQALRYLKLSDGYLPDIAPVLRVSTSVHGDATNQGGNDIGNEGPNNVLVPALEELALSKITFVAAEVDMYLTGQPLMDALANRNNPRGQLILTKCDWEDHGRMPDVVLSWEGKIMHTHDAYVESESPVDLESGFED